MSIKNKWLNERGLRRSHCAQAVMLALGALSFSALAQETTTQRVEVTGSSIKRIEGETPLPVQIIKREDIDKLGVTTASELLQTITANVGGLTDGASITDTSSGQRGFNSANLRGLGASNTLVLLNGRRLANFATPGDNNGVDLNNIPFGAIQRVEVLKDGASAVYGTDAIAGVINFITRRDYQGADISVRYADTQHGGADKQSLTVAGGYGDLSKDRFNIFGTFDYQKLGSLNAQQRDFIAKNDIPRTLPLLLSSNTLPARVSLSSGQFNQLLAAQPNAGWDPSNRNVNFAKPTCNPPTNVYVANGPAGPNTCSYNYMQDTEIYPDSTKQNFISRAVFQINPDHQFFTEGLVSNTKTDYVLSPATSGRIRTSEGIRFPASLQASTGITTPVDFRFRLSDAGNRANEVTSDATRLVAGFTGTFAEWDYDTAFNHSVNKVKDKDTGPGWVSFSGMINGIKNGLYNPFELSTTTAGRDFMRSIVIEGGERSSKSESNTFDGKFSRSLSKLAGGDLTFATGFEFRRESQDFGVSAAINANDITGDRSSSGKQIIATSNTRDVRGLFAEINAPFNNEWEGQLAVRQDKYYGVEGVVGNTTITTQDLTTTNPKVALSYRPSKQTLFRSSASSGFRAPSISDLFRPVVTGVTASFLRDPVSGLTDQFPVDHYANPDLKPEKSKQYNIGMVLEPNSNWNGSLDYWNIKMTDVISDIAEDVVFETPSYYNNLNIVHRFFNDPTEDVEYVELKKANRGTLKTSGLDLVVNWRSDPTSAGRFGVRLNGTYVLEYKNQSEASAPLISRLGNFSNDKAVQRWRSVTSLDWDYEAYSLTLTNIYLSGYTDQNVPGLSIDPNHDVKAYSLWDLTGFYKISKTMKISGGVINLFDTDPPFTNQSKYFQTSWDPTYGDPRGRSYYVSLQYKFM